MASKKDLTKNLDQTATRFMTPPTEQTKIQAEKPQKAPEAAQANKSTPEPQNAEFGQNTKAQKAKKEVFSCRVDSESIETWKLYAAISNSKMSDIVTAAMTEYINNHPLTDHQKKEYQDAAEQAIRTIKEM